MEPWYEWENTWSWPTCGPEPASPWECVEAPEVGQSKRGIKALLQGEGEGVLPGWWPLRMPWSHIVQGQAPPGAMGKGWGRCLQDRECRVGGGGRTCI